MRSRVDVCVFLRGNEVRLSLRRRSIAEDIYMCTLYINACGSSVGPNFVQVSIFFFLFNSCRF